MRKAIVYIAILLLAGGSLLRSCHKEYFQLDKISDELELNPDIVVPLIHGSMSIGDIVAHFDSLGHVDEFDDGLIYLAYAETMVDLFVDTLDLVIDGLYQEIYYSPEIGNNPIFIASGVGDTLHFRKSKYFSLVLEGESRLDSIIFKEGEMLTELESTFLHNGSLTISSEYILDRNKNPFSRTMIISDASGNYTWSGSTDLEGFTLETVKMGDSAVFRMDYDLALINSGMPIFPGNYCEINTHFLDMRFSRLYGIIDPREVVSNEGVLDIPIYDDFPELTHLKLADPRINIFTENSLGVPFELALDSVIATASDGTTVSLQLYDGDLFKIPAPSLAQAGETAYGEIHIDNQTSNFRDLLNIAPSTLSYRTKGMIDQEIPDQHHFVFDTSRFMAEAEFLLPLDFSFTEYALMDTLDFELEEGGVDTALVKDVVISIATVNEIPLELGLQVYLMDESHMKLDSVFEDNFILLPPSVVDQEGRLVSASENDNSVSFDTEKLGSFDHTHYLMIEARMLTAGSENQFVKFYSDYTLDFEISLYANLRINTMEL